MVSPATDPWAVHPPEVRSTTRATVVLRAALAAALGSFGPIAAVVDHGSDGARGALVLALTALGVEAAGRLGASGRPVAMVVLAAVVGSIAEALAQPLIGRIPVPLVLLGVLAADLAVLGWPWLSRGRRPPGGPAALALAVLAPAQIYWIRVGDNAPMVAALCVALLLAVLHEVGVRWVVAGGALLVRALTRVASALGFVVFVVLAVPLIYIPGAIASAVGRASPSHRRWTDASGNWVRRDTFEQPPASTAHQTFAPTRRAVAVRRNIIGVGCLVTVVGLVAWAVWPDAASRDDPAGDLGRATPATGAAELFAAVEAIERVPYSDRPAYRGVPFADALQAEFRQLPLVDGGPGGYGVGDFEGEYIETAGGIRRSTVAGCDCPRVALEVVGGSSAFGLGQRDDHTIASELVRLAEAEGIALDVANTGVPGYTIVQEREALTARLDEGSGSPDMVVFYDGYNDVVGTIVGSPVDGADPELSTILDPDAVGDFFEWVSVEGREVDGADLGAVAAHRYRRQAEAVVEDLEARGIASEFFFQADAFSYPLQRAPVDDLYRDVPPLHDIADLPAALGAAADDLEPLSVNLRDLFVGHPRPVFADSVHTNEEGARIVAAAIYEEIRDELARRAS